MCCRQCTVFRQVQTAVFPTVPDCWVPSARAERRAAIFPRYTIHPQESLFWCSSGTLSRPSFPSISGTIHLGYSFNTLVTGNSMTVLLGDTKLWLTHFSHCPFSSWYPRKLTVSLLYLWPWLIISAILCLLLWMSKLSPHHCTQRAAGTQKSLRE